MNAKEAPPPQQFSGKHSFVKGCFVGGSKSWKNGAVGVDSPSPEIYQQPLDTILG